MSRKDNVFSTFMNHALLNEKYELTDEETQVSLSVAVNSEIPIIKTIALLVTEMEAKSIPGDVSLKNIVNQYLNTASI